MSPKLPATPNPDPEWILVEEGFTLPREHEIESLFAIGNGFVGSRASLAEGSLLSAPATFVAGVFDLRFGGTPALAIVPDWSGLTIAVEGEPLKLDSGEALEHRRILDLRQAMLWRDWRHRAAAGRVTRVRSVRLASYADRQLLIQCVSITPENYSGLISICSAVGHAVSHRTGTGVLLALASRTRFIDGTTVRAIAEDITTARTFRVALGQACRLDRLASVHTSRDDADPEGAARAHAEGAVATDLGVLIEEHRAAWGERWRACDVRIAGDPAAQRAVRFAMYHLLSAVNPEDRRASIGARALAGSAYKGHVFWDTEIFMLPFFTLTFPEAARSLLMYRYHTLPAARRRAAAFNYRGALYAWESADTGDDVTPSSALLPGGKLIPILTGEQEHHISADVAYAVWSYWRATGDETFLLSVGAEILIETARFWASRAEPHEDGGYHICKVIGPDEYHETVDDNAYTNGMAKWNLVTAARACGMLAERWPDRWQALSTRVAVGPGEPPTWLAIARDMYTGFDERTRMFEQFRGYFELEDIGLSALEPRSAPLDVLLGQERVQGSQLIKQADVLMLLYLLWDEYPPDVHEVNFGYYEPRCGHGSSLSPSIHALFAARLGDRALAARYFRQAIEIDLADNMGNAAGGVHAAALGGIWQAVVFGFAGLHLTDFGPQYRPNLHPDWSSLSVRLTWQGRTRKMAFSTTGTSGVEELLP